MRPAYRLRAAGIMTVNVRLWLINSLLAGAIVVVIGQTWNTLDQHRASADHLSALRLAHYYHRNAAPSHDSVQSEVVQGLRERELGVKPRRDVVTRVGQHAEHARTQLGEAGNLLLPDALLAGHRRLQPDAQRHIDAAERVAALSERDVKAAGPLAGYFEVLRAGMATGLDAIVSLAHCALYRAKQGGRNRVMAAAPGSSDDAHRLAAVSTSGQLSLTQSLSR